MAKLTEKQLRERDAKRDIGAELLRSAKQMKSGRAGRLHKVAVSSIAEVRLKVGLSQAQFASLLGVSVRTLQDWEQGRRAPLRRGKDVNCHRRETPGRFT